jgi:adenine-specific DNA-methyltransferase
LEPLSPKEIGVFLTEGMDEVYVNGDSFIPGARVLEMLFQERMLAPVEA